MHTLPSSKERKQSSPEYSWCPADTSVECPKCDFVFVHSSLAPQQQLCMTRSPVNSCLKYGKRISLLPLTVRRIWTERLKNVQWEQVVRLIAVRSRLYHKREFGKIAALGSIRDLAPCAYVSLTPLTSGLG